MSEHAAKIAESLNAVEAASLIAVGDAGKRGWWIHGGGANWAAIVIVNKRHPGLFVGFPEEEDPLGERVTLTGIGEDVAEILKARLPSEPAALPPA